MEIQKVVVKVEIGSVAVQAFATLSGPEATAAGAAGASAALAVELQGAIAEVIEVRPPGVTFAGTGTAGATIP